MIQIKKHKLLNFLNKIKVDGGINELILDFTDIGMQLNCVDLTQTICVDAILLKSAFEEYESIGKVGLSELSTLISIINKFNEIVEMNVDGNLLVLKQKGKKVELEITDAEFITNTKDSPKLEFNETFNINASNINSFINDISVNATKSVIIKTEPKKVILTNKGRYKFTQEYSIDEIVGGVNIRFGLPLIQAVKAFKDDIEISLKQDDSYPMLIAQHNDDYKINIIIAPLAE